MEELGDADPRRIGPYELVGKLGSGGMGRVYLGRSAAGALAAVKVVHPDLARDPEFRRRFQREVAATVAVSGPHVAAIVHADAEADQPWLATEYVAGPSLEAKIAQDGPLPPHEVAELGARLAGALLTIHAAGLVHRDVKPSNILLAADGPRLIDFGIARDTADSRLTRTGVAVGTPAFMAPEQIQGESETGPATDVFALAGVLVQAATGGYPFGEGTAVQLLYRIVHEQPRLAGVPEGMRPVLTACLDKDSARRPTAGQLADALAVPSGFAATTEPIIRSSPTTQPGQDAIATEPFTRGSAPTQSAGLNSAAVRPLSLDSGGARQAVPSVAAIPPTRRAGAGKQKAYILGGVGVVAAAVALVIATSGSGGVLGGSGSGSGNGSGASGGAGLAGAADSALPAGSTSTSSAPGQDAALTSGPTATTTRPSGVPAASVSGSGASSAHQASSTTPGQSPTGSSSASGSHGSTAIPPSSGATTSHPASKPSSSPANAPTAPVCGTDSCAAMSHTTGAVHSVHASKCITANTSGAQYQLPPLGACTSPAAQWRIWRASSTFMLESLYYPGDCLAYGASTLAPCSSDYVKSGWWVSSAESQHVTLSYYANYGYCASVDDHADLTSASCEVSPVPDWQLWDIR